MPRAPAVDAPGNPDAGHAEEVASGARFPFGDNWRRFLNVLDDERIADAERSLREMLGVADLSGRSFLDIGSGSGLFSLAARRLGARVRSFDYDPQSVACTEELRRRYFPGDIQWEITAGSAIGEPFMRSLQTYDVVYSWGVLHHTGQMWRGLKLADLPVREGGDLLIAIYNDQGRASRRWHLVKRMYCAAPAFIRPLILCAVLVRLWSPTFIRGVLSLRLRESWRGSKPLRGMSRWRDAIDWCGGLPFEVATPDAIFDFYSGLGYQLRRMKTVQGLGCNQFVFRKGAGQTAR